MLEANRICEEWKEWKKKWNKEGPKSNIFEGHFAT